MTKLYLGYSDDDRAQCTYARFFNPQLPPFQPHVAEALLAGGVAHELMYPVSRANALHDEGYWPLESGYARVPGGEIRIACLTRMPGVTPAMWDWWFAWHGCETQRYKLWHPGAHVSASWKDGSNDATRYVGRTSQIVEYIGSGRVGADINFVAPAGVGLDEETLRARGEVAICARVSLPGTPINAGWLVHQVRPVPDGAEMRSRMWLGGANIALGDSPGPVSRVAATVIALLARPMLPDPAELFVHNAQEMAHLAAFLPELYEAFGPAA